jgi:uncharacterized protein (TIGR02145 family)
MKWGLRLSELIRIPVKKVCNIYYVRWYYSGWHYWAFLPGKFTVVTEGEKYRTIGTRKLSMGSGQVTLDQVDAIKTVMNTREVYLLTIAGWMNIRIEPGTLTIFDNQINGAEIEFVAIIGSKEITYTDGFSPVVIVPVVIPPVTLCETVIGTQIWYCKNFESNYPASKVYADNESYRTIYGGLYNYEQIRSDGFAPTGWHIPTVAEWNTLITYLGGLAAAGGHLKSLGVTYWNAPNTDADDSSGFDARGAGYFSSVFSDLKNVAKFWAVDYVNQNDRKVVKLTKNTGAVEIVSANLTGTVTTIQNNLPGVTPIARVDMVALSNSSNCGSANVHCQGMTRQLDFNTNKYQTSSDFVDLYQGDFAGNGQTIWTDEGHPLTSSGNIYFRSNTPGTDFNPAQPTSITSIGTVLDGIVTDHLIPNIAEVIAQSRKDYVTFLDGGTDGVHVHFKTGGLQKDAIYSFNGMSTAGDFVSTYEADYLAINILLYAVKNTVYIESMTPGTDNIVNTTCPSNVGFNTTVVKNFRYNVVGVTPQARVDSIQLTGTAGNADLRCQNLIRNLPFTTNINDTAQWFANTYYWDYYALNILLGYSGDTIYFVARYAGIDFYINDTSITHGVLLKGSVTAPFIANRAAVIALPRIDRLTIDPTCEGGSADIYCTGVGKPMTFNATVNQTVIDFYNIWQSFFFNRNALMSKAANTIDFMSTIPGTDTLTNTAINPSFDKSPDYYSLRLIKDTPAFITDIDGNQYTYITIGTQIWMVENLRTTHYRDGSPIPNLTLAADWMVDVDGAYCWYNNDIGYKVPYGALYNWDAVNHGNVIAGADLAPAGWRVPSETDFNVLIAYIGGLAVGGGKLKEIGLAHWLTPNLAATDSYGFKGLGAGLRNEFGNFSQINQYSYMRGSTENAGTANEIELEYDDDEIIHDVSYNQIPGLSVRLMRDL